MSPHKVIPKEAICLKGGRSTWLMGSEAYEKRMPHDEGIKALWETKWQFPCRKSIQPFQEGKYEDFEPIFNHLIENEINDDTSTEYTQSFFPTASALEHQGDDQMSAGNYQKASSFYLRACTVLRIARFPHATSQNSQRSCPLKQKAWEMLKKIYLKAGRTWDLPVEEAIIPHIRRDPKSGDRERISIYVRLPEITVREGQICPVVVLMTGLDECRPDHTRQCDEILARGWGCMIVEVPGTGDCPADVSDPESPDRLWSSVLDWMEAVRFFDMKRVMVWGLSAAGYYAVRIAHTHRERLVGAVAQGAGVHFPFEKEWLKFADGHAYASEFSLAMVMKHGYETVEEYMEDVQKKSILLESGLLYKPSKILLINGTADGLMPIGDSAMFSKYGTPKEGRFSGAAHIGCYMANASVYSWMESVMEHDSDKREL